MDRRQGGAVTDYERGFRAGVEAAANILQRHIRKQAHSRQTVYDAVGIMLDNMALLSPERAERGEGARCGHPCVLPKGHRGVCSTEQPAPPASGAPDQYRTHYVGDDCPGGHREPASGAPRCAECPYCEGTGIHRCREAGCHQEGEECIACDGTGRCAGSGKHGTGGEAT
jgi:hypothetical protein